MTRLFYVPELSTIPAGAPERARRDPQQQAPASPKPTTFTGLIGAIFMFPLRAIIAACVALRIHPNTLTLVGVIINVGAAWALGMRPSGRRVSSG